ncbi:hypothetical protein EMPS_07731 [Entomortierella parvispora]|uniref:Uncharacterized protein n=1 Tax=Entomortierella parvispora TaxID=205924 RepID=A0A9P3HF35_9FUNG|nr:hypothetical protein EMPS_07731 [Entomortierella parvispora]
MTDSRFASSFRGTAQTYAHEDRILSQEQQQRDHVARQSRKLIHLLQSMNCPQDMYSADELERALLDQYQLEGENAHYLGEQRLASPSSQFLDWLLQNVNTTTNWPDHRKNDRLWDSREGEDMALENKDAGDDEESIFEEEMRSLDQEHLQLQQTLAAMEKEMADLKALESYTRDQERALDLDLHDISIQFDAMLRTLEEGAQKSTAEFLPSTISGSGSVAGLNIFHHSQRGTQSSSSRSFPANQDTAKGYLYLQLETLQELQQMDKAFADQMDSYYDQIMSNIECRDTSSTTGHTAAFSSLPLASRFEQLLKRNPAEDKELVRLCSIYRATKMSHIRATAQLKCLEQELDFMQALYTQKEVGDAREQAAADQDMTTEYVVSVANSKMKLQRSKQQHELEMISVQREISRLEGEMEQVLSDPDPPAVRTPTKRDPRIDLMGDVHGRDQDEGGEPRDEDERRGVLVDVCERIARTDLELRFVSAAHRDYIETQKRALLDLDQSLDRLLEYYCSGVLMEQILEKERDAMKTQKDLLWAAIQECQDHQRQSNKLRTELSRAQNGTQESLQSSSTFSPSRSTLDKDRMTLSQQRESDEFLGLVKRNEDIQERISDERWTMVHTHIGEVSSVVEDLNQRLLHQYSSTEEVQFVPREVYDAKRSLESRSIQLKQEYLALSKQIEKLLGRQQ